MSACPVVPMFEVYCPLSVADPRHTVALDTVRTVDSLFSFAAAVNYILRLGEACECDAESLAEHFLIPRDADDDSDFFEILPEIGMHLSTVEHIYCSASRIIQRDGVDVAV